MRERGAIAAAVIAFAASALASAALTIVYWLGGQPQLEGVLLSVALGGLGGGLIVAAKGLMPGGGHVESREPHRSAGAERAGARSDFRRGEQQVGRRRLLTTALGAALGALGVAALFPIRSLGARPGRSLFRTAWRAGARLVTHEGRPVRASDLDVNGILTVFPEGATEAADSQVVLIRHDPDSRMIGGRRDWAPDGFIAYSKVCTHAGCPVGLYEPTSDQLFCPCHQSAFNVLDGAKPTAGPATRALPQLPIAIDPSGYLYAMSDFTEPVGPGFWDL